MKQIYYTFRYLIRHRGNSTIKIISLTLGLAMSLVLFAQVAFELSYDRFFPDVERIYRIRRVLSMGNQGSTEKTEMNIPVINAPVPGAMWKEFPEIEKATVGTSWSYDAKYTADGQSRFEAKTMIADSMFLEMFTLPLLSGDRFGFREPTAIYLSETTANRIYGGTNVVGKALREGEEVYTVKGVFRDVPKNSHIQFDVLRSMTIFGSYPGWHNNDAYIGYVKFVPGTDPETTEAKIPAMLRKYYDVDEEIKNGTRVSYYFEPVNKIHLSEPAVKKTVLILWLMAFSILIVSSMNYVLISISSLANRAKSIGVQKCNGASSGNIFSLFMWETGLLIFVSLVLSVLLILGFRDQIEELMHTSISSIFALNNLWAPGVVLLLLIVLAGMIPGRIFAVVPVTQVFRQFGAGKRRWKQTLLFIQFAGVAFMMTLLLILVRQYSQVLHQDLGYTTDNLVYSQNLGRLKSEQMPMLKAEFERSPQVKKSSIISNMPIEGISGTIVKDIGTKEQLFSSRFIYTDIDFLEVMDITLKLGTYFKENTNSTEKIVVNEKFVELAGIKDNPLGKTFDIGMGGNAEIIGVVKNFHLGSLYTEQMPLLILPMDPSIGSAYGGRGNLVLKLVSPDRMIVQEFNDQLKKFTQDNDSYFRFYSDAIETSYQDARLLRNAIFIAALVLFLITSMGIFGYIADEIFRRTKEIGIRRVNGASTFHILKLIASDIAWIAIPAIMVGMSFSVLLGQKWQEQFVVKVPLNASLFLSSGLFVLSVIIACVILRSWRAAHDNPIHSLKNE